MATYDFKDIEKKWQEKWRQNQTFKTSTDFTKPKFYVLDMFPYPSGAGLHVGHPLGYIASDIVSRFKKNLGFNVLHPMGYDAFGLPAEQYAIQTGQHPAITTEANIARYREQLDKIGFSFDWEREVRTCDPKYYKWTQWIFLQLFHSWYNHRTQKAEKISDLIKHFETQGNFDLEAAHDCKIPFNESEWKQFSEKEKQEVLMSYRLAYLSEASVWWCAELGSVLANDEVVNGVSERGGYPVERKVMKQWSLRISAYADRLLDGLQSLKWSESIKESQRNWIGKSFGCSVCFFYETAPGETFGIEVFTTRPDTIFGVSFIALAPEHSFIELLTTAEQKEEVEKYVAWAKNRSERERQADVKKITGVFTGSYVRHPFTHEPIPIWIADYVLAGYGTGAVMAVPAHDSRDYAFAKHFNLPIKEVVQGGNIEEEAYESKEGILINSAFINGLSVPEAIRKVIEAVENDVIGLGKVNFRLRDAVFGRQRYWGEPIPMYYKDGIPYPLEESELPLILPQIDKYLPTETGEPPLARATDWKYKGQFEYEQTTMPGWAGSSWYFLRYMDAHNEQDFVGKNEVNYWKSVDLYVGGSEHATGHLLYVRFWTKVLFDLGKIPVDEPAFQLVNQGMIQGRSSIIYRINGTNQYVSYGLRKNYEVTPVHVDVNIVENDVLDIEALKKWRSDFENAEFILEDGKYICGAEVEKMSKRWYNVVNPDDVCEKYGADTFRMYEMFLGPLEQSKPWNTQGITGVHGFLKRFWSLFYDDKGWKVTEDEPTKEELKHVHTLLKKVKSDIENLSLNTTVAQYMICCNELMKLKCSKKQILEPFLIALSPFAPHICEELWEKCGHSTSISMANFPEVKEEYLVEDSFEYPISINGKVKHKINLPLSLSQQETSDVALEDEKVKELIAGKELKKIIVVHGRIINLVTN